MLEELAERIEKLDGPDREVDAEIAVSVLGMERDGPMFFGKDEDFVLERDYYSLEGSHRELPAFTASLDAAMTLVPEGWDFRAERFDAKKACAAVWLRGWHDDTKLDTEASTPALALCAAALRALAKEE